MYNKKLMNGAIGAIVGYAAGSISGHFIKPQYTHHLGFIAATVGFLVGYNKKTDEDTASMAAPAIATAPAPAATA